VTRAFSLEGIVTESRSPSEWSKITYAKLLSENINTLHQIQCIRGGDTDNEYPAYFQQYSHKIKTYLHLYLIG